MRTYRPFRIMSIFLVAAAIVALVWCQNGNCVETGQKLKEEMRMPWSRPEGGFLREWLLCGVFPSPPRAGDEHPRQGHDIDYLRDLGGEAAVRPVVGQTVKRPDGSIATWTEYTSDSDIVDFTRSFVGQRNTDTVAYAYTAIDRAEAGKAVLALGSDDSVKIWLNGELVHNHAIGRGVQKDEDIVSVMLNQGDNSLLIKVDNGSGGWGFIVRVLSEPQALALEAVGIQPRIQEPQEDKHDLLVVSTEAGPSIMIPEIIHIEAVAAGGKVLASAEAKRGESVSLETKDWPDGPYEIRVSKRSPEGYRVFRHMPWYKGDWLKQVRELVHECRFLHHGGHR